LVRCWPANTVASKRSCTPLLLLLRHAAKEPQQAHVTKMRRLLVCYYNLLVTTNLTLSKECQLLSRWYRAAHALLSLSYHCYHSVPMIGYHHSVAIPLASTTYSLEFQHAAASSSAA
jgi:hypothetical protein